MALFCTSHQKVFDLSLRFNALTIKSFNFCAEQYFYMKINFDWQLIITITVILINSIINHMICLDKLWIININSNNGTQSQQFLFYKF